MPEATGAFPELHCAPAARPALAARPRSPAPGSRSRWPTCRRVIGRFASPLWPDLVADALVLPLGTEHGPAPSGFLVVGLSPRRPFDSDYRDFLHLVAEQIGTAIANARVFEDQRDQARKTGRDRPGEDDLFCQCQP